MPKARYTVVSGDACAVIYRHDPPGKYPIGRAIFPGDARSVENTRRETRAARRRKQRRRKPED